MAVFGPAVCFRQLCVQPSLRHHHELRGAKSASERGVGGEGGGIAAGITELQNPQRDTRTLTEREREREKRSHKLHHSQLDGTTVKRVGKKTGERDLTSIRQKDEDEVD